MTVLAQAINQMLRFLILPPGGLLLALAAGLLFSRRRFDRAWWLAGLSAVLLLAASLPVVSSALLASLEIYPALPVGDLPPGQARAVVILAAESMHSAEYGKPTVGPLSLVRLRYGAWLSQRTRLPILVSGGRDLSEPESLAAQMRDALEMDQGLAAAWVEDQSEDTWQNAEFSARVLKAQGISTVYLVTHAWHMRRAVIAFHQAGLEVIAAPTAFINGVHAVAVQDLLPNAKAMQETYYAVHEYAGIAVYSAMAWWKSKAVPSVEPFLGHARR
jgi:uncharacterized SAM-binding protein YcdF (DUF218 family)